MKAPYLASDSRIARQAHMDAQNLENRNCRTLQLFENHFAFTLVLFVAYKVFITNCF